MTSKTNTATQDAATAVLEAATKGHSVKTLAKGRSDLFRLDPRDLSVKPGWNARDLTSPENAEHVDVTARSIAEVGVKEPLTVYAENGFVFVSDGHVRLAATLRAIEVYGATVPTVPVKTEDRGSNDADRVLSQLLRNSGKPLTTLEKSKVVKTLLGFGWLVEDIAKKVGLTVNRINALLDLAEAPEAVKEMITKGEVSASLAAQVLAENGAEGGAEVLADAVETAKEQGKEKATAKHVGKLSLSKRIKAFVPAVEKVVAEAVESADGETVTFTGTMTAAEFRQFRELFNV